MCADLRPRIVPLPAGSTRWEEDGCPALGEALRTYCDRRCSHRVASFFITRP